MLMIRPLCALVISLTFLLCAREARAGDCLDGSETYVKEVEEYARDASRVGDAEEEGFACLATYAGCRISQHNVKWAGARAQSCFAKARKFSFRARITKACAAILGRKKDKHAVNCLVMLARTGVAAAGKHDIYAELIRLAPEQATPAVLTVLHDPRAIDYLIQQYRDALEAEKKIKKDRWSLRASINSRREVINALWHFAAQKSAAFLEEVVAGAKDQDIRERATRALQRIKEESAAKVP
jgi:hypothetical protein